MNMREKMARALAEKRNARRVREGMEDLGVLTWDFEDADAVLAAMREPDARMCSQGPYINEVNPNAPPITESQADACWTAMIAAAQGDRP